MHPLTLPFEILARAGGGGSVGGGIGIGGGFGPISFILLVFVVFIPGTIGAYIRKMDSSKFGKYLTVTICLLLALVWYWVGGLFLAIFYGTITVLMGLTGFHDGFGKIKRASQRVIKTRQIIKQAAQTDHDWQPNVLQARVTEVFKSYQEDWSNFDTAAMREYLTPNYWQHAALIMQAIQLRQRQDIVKNVQITSADPARATDEQGTDDDQVVYAISATATDTLVDTYTNSNLFVDTSPFTEYWAFKRVNGKWMLDNIVQNTWDIESDNNAIKKFAVANQMFYAADWGWLLLPQQGHLFGKGKFGTSDVNNHVIGMYHDLLVELYTYNEFPGMNGCVVAQAALPKRYDSIIVEAEHETILSHTPKGYTRVSLEWPDFNKRYTIYATDTEKVTAFELLNPTFMEKLFALNFKVNIEVVDNVVYLYTYSTTAKYDVMFNILRDAFEEMKL